MVAELTHGRVAHDQRHTRRNPCPVCAGGADDKRGRGIRCYGFTTEDGRWAACTNESYAGTLAKHLRTDAYWHLLDGACKCGETHGGVAPASSRHAPERPHAPTQAHKRHAPTDTYPYRALGSGEPLRKLRYGSGKGKSFVWQRADGTGDWLDCHGDRPTPDAYRAAAIADADPWEPLFITEGEKDADRVAQLGGVVISPPDGAGSWLDAYSPYTAGRQVVICADADEKGETHAQAVAQSVMPYAASVRIVRFSDAHDVGDWLDARHTFTELRALAATACIITAQLPQSRNSNPAMQDDTPTETLKSCPNCQTWQDRARIAETTVANLRREQAMTRRILAMPKEQLSPSLKPAAIAVRNVLTRPRARDDEGLEQVYRREIAQQCGVSDQTASTYLRDLAKAGIIRREVVKSFDTSEIRIGEGPLFDTPEAIEEQPRTWGGRRVKVCVACGSDNLETRVICRECGTLQSAEDTNRPEPPDDTPDGGDAPQSRNSNPASQVDTPYDDAPDGEAWQDDAQEYSPALDTYVVKLAPHAQEEPPIDPRADVLALAEACGWPALQIAHLRPLGELGWRSVMRAATPDQIATARCALVTRQSQGDTPCN